MNQFIIENPVLSIVIAYIIGAVIMHITSAITIRMAVEKEVGKAMGEEDDERIGLYPVKPSNAPVPPAPIIHKRVLPIWLGKDECGITYVYFDKPEIYENGTGPLSEHIEGVYYHTPNSTYIDITDLYKDEDSNFKDYLINEAKSMENLPYGIKKIILYDNDVVKMLNAIPGFH